MPARIRRGDTVVIIAGKDRHKPLKERTGKVLRVMPSSGRVIVDGLNMVKKHRRPRQQGEQAGIITQPAGIATSNLMLLCSSCNRPARIGIQRVADGTAQRICRRCKEVVAL